MQEEIRVELYRMAGQKYKEAGYWMNKVDNYLISKINSPLYQAALAELGKTSCHDGEILPAVFGDCSELFRLCKNSSDFWAIAQDYFLGLGVEAKHQRGKTKAEILQQAIIDSRIENQRINVDRTAIIEGRCTYKQIAKYVAYGVILVDDDTDDFEPNPLYFSDDEYLRWVEGRKLLEKA